MYFWTICCNKDCLQATEYNWKSERELLLKTHAESEEKLKEMVERCPRYLLRATLLAYINGKHYVEDFIDVKDIKYEKDDKFLKIWVFIDF